MYYYTITSKEFDIDLAEKEGKKETREFVNAIAFHAPTPTKPQKKGERQIISACACLTR